MSDKKKQRSRGLGDTVKKAIEVTTFGMVKQKEGCGCQGRQAWLNKKFPYKWYKTALADVELNKAKKAAADAEVVIKITEEILTDDQKAIRDKIVEQRLGRARKTISQPQPKTPARPAGAAVPSQGSNPIEKPCAPCEKARLERERLAKEKLEKEQEG